MLVDISQTEDIDTKAAQLLKNCRRVRMSPECYQGRISPIKTSKGQTQQLRVTLETMQDFQSNTAKAAILKTRMKLPLSKLQAEELKLKAGDSHNEP